MVDSKEEESYFWEFYNIFEIIRYEFQLVKSYFNRENIDKCKLNFKIENIESLSVIIMFLL